MILVTWNRWGAAEPIIAGKLGLPKDQNISAKAFASALRAALTAALHDLPDLYVRSVERDGKLHLQYAPFPSKVELEAWLDRVIDTQESPQGQSIEDAFEQARHAQTAPGGLLSPVQGRTDAFLSVTWIRYIGESNNDQLSDQQLILLRGWHVLLDGLTILEVFSKLLGYIGKALSGGASALPTPSFNGDDAQRLSPHALDCIPGIGERYQSHSPDQSAWATYLSAKEFGLPLSKRYAGREAKWETEQPTSRHHFRLSTRASAAIFKQAKEHGVTVNTFYAAAQIVAVLRLLRSSPEAASDSPITLAQLHTTNLRPFMTGEAKNTCASAAEGLIAAADSRAWDDGLRNSIPLAQLEQETVWSIAGQLRDFTRIARKDPLEVCSAASHDFWRMFNAAGDAMANGQMAK